MNMRLYNWHKKRYFVKKLATTYKQLWEVEFLRVQLANTRELVRRQYDQLKEELFVANDLFTQEKKKKEPDKLMLENLPRISQAKEKDIAQIKEQLDKLDVQLHGERGADDAVSSFRGIIKALKEYRDKL